jgi:hypothetical protein
MSDSLAPFMYTFTKPYHGGLQDANDVGALQVLAAAFLQYPIMGTIFFLSFTFSLLLQYKAL